jgi:hypothetical protein
MPFLRKYGTGTGADVIIPIIKRGVVDFAVTADWTPASGDVKVSKDGGTEANIGTLPVINGTVGWKFVFSDAELQCKSLTVRVVDSATKAVEDQFFVVETYGHASAMFVVDFSTAAFGAVMPTTAGRTLAVSAAGAVELDSATATQIDTIEAALTTLGSDSTTVERSVSDTNAITFSWPVSDATITGTASLNNGSYGAVAGAIAFLRTETGRHYYTLAYNVADRPAAEGQVRYKFVDGTYTGYVVLRTVNLVTAAQVNAQVLDVLSVDTFGELSSPPAATSSLKDKLGWLFMWARNRSTQSATQRKLYADDATTIVSTETVGDDGTTFTKGEAS